MTPADVSPAVQPFQFWASLRPLSLVRIEAVSEDYFSAAMTIWNVQREEDATYVLPLPEHFRYLSHYSKELPAERFENAPVAGDILLGDFNGPDSNELVFVGVSTTGEKLLLTEKPYPHDLVGKYTIFQPGPGYRGVTYWDHLDADP